MATLIGNNIGRGDAEKARAYFYISHIPMIINIAGQAVLIGTYAEQIIGAFTDIEEVRETAMTCMNLYLINLIPDSVRGQTRGVIKGLGLQA